MDTRSTVQHLHLVTHPLPTAVLLELSGEVDLDSVEPLRLALHEAVGRGEGPVVVDLSAVGFADTALINTLLHARLRLGDRLRLAAPSRAVLRLLRILRLGGVFAIHADQVFAIHADQVAALHADQVAALRDGPVPSGNQAAAPAASPR
ncbi:STAS domain-containing protein [Streptomyces sp. NBC_00963]|uniref:STAS domain-containing protein n=1 Tax=Streptomyces sp. NBC_00963 TaxID=2903697 RepID=UPI0038641303|nr:STAS domain-containing protein [Streptomyces sp. NBC_00963]